MRRSKWLLAIGCVLVLLIGGAYVLTNLDLDWGRMKSIFGSSEAFREFILSFGIWAPLAFFIAQVVQVIVSPIPGNITGLMGGALFGWVNGFLLNGFGVLVGSTIAFFIARVFGQAIVIRLVGQEVYRKYGNFFTGKFFFGLFLIFLFPFFPDDALCFLAGLSTLSFPLFVLLVVFGRMPGMLVAALAGAGVVVFSALEWAIIGVISVIAIYLVFKYRKQVEIWMHRKLGLEVEAEEAMDEGRLGKE